MIISMMSAILKINPNAECSIDGNDLSTIEWRNGTTPIATADIQAKYDEMVDKENKLILVLVNNQVPNIVVAKAIHLTIGTLHNFIMIIRLLYQLLLQLILHLQLT